MRGIDLLRSLHTDEPHLDATDQLARVAKTMRADVDVEKRPTKTTVRLPLDDLQVDHTYQRPPDRNKIAQLLRHLQDGGELPPLEVNHRADGTFWITDGQHRCAARILNGETHAECEITHRPSQDEPQLTNILKVAEDRDGDAITRLLGAGARRAGKQVVLDLGAAGRVAYTGHREEFVGKTERGKLHVDGDETLLLGRLGLAELLQAGDPSA